MPSFLRPKDLEQMRFNQLRSKNTVIAPWNTQQAAEQQIRGDRLPVMLLPASTAQNKWKTPPAGYDRRYASTARAVATMAGRFGSPAPVQMAQPVPFYTIETAVAELNRLPRQQTRLSVTQPLSRGILQRGENQFTNAEEIRAVARARQNPPEAYGVQDNIPSRMFPSSYVFTEYKGQRYVVPGTGVSGLRGRGRR